MRGQIKFTKEDKEWARAVKERDNGVCVICGSNERLNAHHIIPRENHNTKLDVHNGITLCVTHHFFNRQLSAHNSPFGFFLWLQKNRPAQFGYLIKKQEELINEQD